MAEVALNTEATFVPAPSYVDDRDGERPRGIAQFVVEALSRAMEAGRPPMFSEHGSEVLAEAGFTHAEVSRLFARGAVVGASEPAGSTEEEGGT